MRTLDRGAFIPAVSFEANELPLLLACFQRLGEPFDVSMQLFPSRYVRMSSPKCPTVQAGYINLLTAPAQNCASNS